MSTGKTSSTTTVENSGPWAGQQPYLTQGFQVADHLLNGVGPYTGPYVANQSPNTLQAIQLAAQRGMNGSPVMTADQQQLTNTLNGNYLDPNSNPYLSGAVNDALGLAKSQFTGQYGGQAGSNLSNSGYQEGLARTLGNVATTAYANAYQQGRTNQLQAAALAPNAAAQDFMNIGSIANAGQSQDQYQQALVNAQQQAWQAPWTTLQNYFGVVGGGYGGSGNQSNPYFTNPLANALGLGLGGLGLYNGLGSAGLLGGSGATAAGMGSAMGAGDISGELALAAMAA